MLPDNLPDWLSLLEQTHVQYIDLSLARMQKAASALNLLSFNAPVITVGGTNGKGSTVCALENIYHAAGYKTGSTISPHLLNFNERIKINTQSIDDKTLCDAFAAIYAIAQQFQLTFFEVTTLAAFWIFKHADLDVVILEVGLGGRMDAVNVIDPDVAVITSIDLDHTDRLGNTRELIAKEKAGIFRKNIPVICGDHNPPAVLKEIADGMSAKFIQPEMMELPDNGLLPENMRTAVSAVMQLQHKLPVLPSQINQGLMQCNLPGRQQVIYKKCKHIIDVAHNPAGVKKLAERLQLEKKSAAEQILMVTCMFKDKDIMNSYAALKDAVDVWFVAPMQNERSASLAQLKSTFENLNINNVNYYDDLTKAYNAAETMAHHTDIIAIAGSFQTVVELMGKCITKQAPPDAGLLADKVP